MRFPATRRILALADVGERELADAELRRLSVRAPSDLVQDLTAIARDLALPSAAAEPVRRAQALRKPLPLPDREPAGGYRLDPSLLHAVIRAESGFDPDARSPKGALGLMQVMPDTARHVAQLVQVADAGDDWLLEPSNNMAVGQAWLRQLAATPTVKGSLIHLLAAYNAGEGRLQAWLAGELAAAADDPAAVHRERAACRDPRLPQEGAGQSVGLPGVASAAGSPRSRPWPRTAGPRSAPRPGCRRARGPRPRPRLHSHPCPGGLTRPVPFQPLRIAVLTVSDTRTAADDRSGDTLAERIAGAGHQLAARAIVKDDRAAIAAQFRAWIADPGVEVVITTGGTGVTGRDVTPEALAAVADKHIAGFGELFRMLSYKIGTSSLQSRADAAVAGGTYLFCLPGSPGACRDGWDEILRFQLDIRHRPCNFAELLPRLREHERQG